MEAKLQADKIPSHLFHFAERLGNIPILVLVQKNNTLKIIGKNATIFSASRILVA